MTRYPLGPSGLTALFPGVPELRDMTVGAGANAGTVHSYNAPYGLREYIAAYRDLASAAPKNMLSGLTDEILGSLKATTLRQRGDRGGVSTEFTMPGDKKGKMRVYSRGSRVLMLISFGPTPYKDAGTVEAFLKSIK